MWGIPPYEDDVTCSRCGASQTKSLKMATKFATKWYISFCVHVKPIVHKSRYKGRIYADENLTFLKRGLALIELR